MLLIYFRKHLLRLYHRPDFYGEGGGGISKQKYNAKETVYFCKQKYNEKFYI